MMTTDWRNLKLRDNDEILAPLDDAELQRQRYADAKNIDVHEDHATLPGLHELRGTSPKFEEGMSSEEFVRSIRDANW